jgi:pyruvate dehydrogenase E1 component
MYKYLASRNKSAKAKAHLFGSGSILNEAIKAQTLLEEKYGVAADVWSVTSYKQLYRDAIDTERENMLNFGKPPRKPYVSQALENEQGVFVAASDYVKALPCSIARWIPGNLVALGTDGYGRSESREALRDFFEVDARHIAIAALYGLLQEKKIQPTVIKKAAKDLRIDPNKLNPHVA